MGETQLAVKRKVKYPWTSAKLAARAKITRLAFGHPEDAVEARQNVERLAGDGMNTLGSECLAKFGHLGPRAFIEPGHTWPQRRAIFCKRAKSLALVGNRNGGDARGVDNGRHLPQGRFCRRPPIIRFLFEITALRVGQRNRHPPLSNRMTARVQAEAFVEVVELSMPMIRSFVIVPCTKRNEGG